MSPFEAQKRDTEGPSDEMFAVYRPENVNIIRFI